MPLQKSTTNKQPPNLNEGKAHGASSPKTVPNRPGSTKNRVILTGSTTRASNKSTFRAPRSNDSGSNPMTCGYTKPGKM